MDNTFINDVSTILNTAFKSHNIRCTVRANSFVSKHSGTIEFILPNNPGQSASIEIRIFPMNTNPPQLYFELLKSSVLYFPYMTEIWNIINNSGVRPQIIQKWNDACHRNGCINYTVQHYYYI